MMSASKLRNACPGCRTQLQSFYESGFKQILPHSRVARPLAQSHRNRTGLVARRVGGARQFSSTATNRQQSAEETGQVEGEGEAPVDGSEGTEARPDNETLVRQARQTFGNTLPPGYLNAEEYKLYERLYGPPLRETRPEDVGIRDGVEILGEDRNVLLREDEHGVLEEVEYTIDEPTPEPSDITPEDGEEVPIDTAVEDVLPFTGAQLDYISVTANNEREYDALLQLQRDFEAARLEGIKFQQEKFEQEKIEAARRIEEEAKLKEEYVEGHDAEVDEDGELSGADQRMHAYTRQGQFKTYPATLQFPRDDFIVPIQALLSRTDAVHVQKAAEDAFGGPGLPDGPATPEMRKSRKMKGFAIDAGQGKMSQIEADAYICTVLPPVYATITSVLTEVRKRLGAGWIQKLLKNPDGPGPRVLDIGGGGAGLAAWEAILGAEWALLQEQGLAPENSSPPGKKTVVVGSDNLRYRISRFLNDTTFLPRLPDYLHSVELRDRYIDANPDKTQPQQRKMYDVIIAAHALMGQERQHKRESLIENLWSMLNPDGGVLIVIEKGHPRGFEAVADAREQLLRDFIIPPTSQSPPEEMHPENEKRRREPGMIVAPCTNHFKCPLYLSSGLSSGRKDYCHFSQRFIRPPFLQRVMGGSHRNHEDIKFSYVAVQRGAHPDSPLPAAVLPTEDAAQCAPPTNPAFLHGNEAADRAFAGYEDSTGEQQPHLLSLPRNIRPPLKRRGHVTMDLCTPTGSIERWTIPKSFSKQAYHDARKAQWGDLWALGAKTRTRSNIRLGKDELTVAKDRLANDGGVRARRMEEKAGGKHRKAKVVEVLVEPGRGVVGAHEKQPKGRIPHERRTKGGRHVQFEDLMKDMGADDLMDPEDEEEARLRNMKWKG